MKRMLRFNPLTPDFVCWLCFLRQLEYEGRFSQECYKQAC